jgi:hypothetical protein
MVHQYRPNFPHKFNEDGSFNSFCAACHMMVGTSRNEAALIHFETSHKCDSVRLYQVGQFGRTVSMNRTAGRFISL